LRQRRRSAHIALLIGRGRGGRLLPNQADARQRWRELSAYKSEGGVSMLSNQAAEGNRKLLPKKAEGDWSNQAEREEGHD
jgi:hypothetical protein